MFHGGICDEVCRPVLEEVVVGSATRCGAGRRHEGAGKEEEEEEVGAPDEAERVAAARCENSEGEGEKKRRRSREEEGEEGKEGICKGPERANGIRLAYP